MLTTEYPLYVIIAGGRDFSNYSMLREYLDILLSNFKDIIVISGTANGADKLGERYAKEKGHKLIRCPADWDNKGRRAGYERNEEMAEIIELNNGNGVCVCFWDGESRGTKHMINIAKSKDIETYICNY